MDVDDNSSAIETV